MSTRRMDTLSIFDRETFLVKCSIGLLSKLQITLPRPALMTIHKALKKKKKNLKKVEWIQYKASLAIRGMTRGTSKEKLPRLGLESLENRPWIRKLCSFLKIFKSHSPGYLFPVPGLPGSLFNIRYTFYKNSYSHLPQQNEDL